MLLRALPLLFIAITAPLSAKDSLGIFSDWGAFRDSGVPRCYAIASAKELRRAKEYEPYASIGTWPSRNIRNQLHIRLSRQVSPAGTIRLTVGDRRFELTGGGGDAWAQDRAMDAAIVAAMRSATRMTVSARDSNGRSFTDAYSLDGVATAMDAATIGCAGFRRQGPKGQTSS